MEEDMAMEVEESPSTTTTSSSPSPSPSPSSMKRFGIKNTIQTNFGDDYVFQIDSSKEISTMAVSLSTNVIKLYSPVTGQYIGECKGHSKPINEISFAGPTEPYVLNSCSSDGTLRFWDTRTFNQVGLLRVDSCQEIFSFSFGGSADALLAAGCKSQIVFWDWRNRKEMARLEESHTDDVIQVKFAPGHQNQLISSSVDGLMCIFNTDGDINDDDHLESVMNVGTSIGKFGFFGDLNKKLWCLTHIETLSIWDWKDGRNEINFQEARTLASDSWNLDHVDHFVDCNYSGADDRLWVIGGTNTGILGYFPVDYSGVSGRIGSPDAILKNGHTGIVRSVLPSSHISGGNSGIFAWTGGEDGRLCCWLSEKSSEIHSSWISSALVMKTLLPHRKIRHHPY